MTASYLCSCSATEKIAVLVLFQTNTAIFSVALQLHIFAIGITQETAKDGTAGLQSKFQNLKLKGLPLKGLVHN